MRKCLLSVFFLLGVAVWFPQSAWPEGSGTWTVLPPTPSVRTEVVAVNHQNKIYVIGGFTPTGISDQVEVFDPGQGTWSQAAPLPRPLHHISAVSANGRIYVIGGFFTGDWTPVNSVYAYDASADRWTEKRPMPTKRGALAAEVIDGKIHVVAGVHKRLFRLRGTQAHEQYDPKTDTWRDLPPLPTARDHVAISVLNGKMYVIGGRLNLNFQHNMATNEVYDSKTGKWETLPSLPTARSGITSKIVNGKIYVFGGEGTGITFNQNEAYDPVTRQWQTLPPMPEASHGLGSAVVDGAIHLFNGGPKPGAGGSTFHQVFTPN